MGANAQHVSRSESSAATWGSNPWGGKSVFLSLPSPDATEIVVPSMPFEGNTSFRVPQLHERDAQCPIAGGGLEARPHFLRSLRRRCSGQVRHLGRPAPQQRKVRLQCLAERGPAISWAPL